MTTKFKAPKVYETVCFLNKSEYDEGTIFGGPFKVIKATSQGGKDYIVLKCHKDALNMTVGELMEKLNSDKNGDGGGQSSAPAAKPAPKPFKPKTTGFSRTGGFNK
jgi:hypothetical protein